MKKNLKSALAVLFTVCLLCASLLPVFAADPNVYKSEGIYLAGGEDPYPFSTTLTFDPASGRLTVDEAAGNIISIENTADLIRWIYKNAVFDTTEKSPLQHISAEKGLKQRVPEVLMFFASLLRKPFFCLFRCLSGLVAEKMYPPC